MIRVSEAMVYFSLANFFLIEAIALNKAEETVEAVFVITVCTGAFGFAYWVWKRFCEETGRG